jgi:putative copper resistance protein D
MSDIWTILTPLLRFAFYPALLLAIGGVIFSGVMSRQMGPAIRAYTGRVTRWAAFAGLCIAGLQIPAAAGNMAGDLAGMGDPLLVALVLETPGGAASLMAAAGFLLIMLAELALKDPSHPLRITGPGLTVLSMLLAGHVTTGGIQAGILLAVHLAGLGFWLGALLPLRAMCRDSQRFGGQVALADLAEMFGRWAIWIVPVLLIAGTLYAVMLVGSVAALVTTPYGQVLMVKAGLVSGLLGLAALNKFRLVSALRRGETTAPLRLCRSIDWELAGVAAVLLATSLMTTSLLLPDGMTMGGM